MKRALILALVLLLGPGAGAQVTLTINGTIGNTTDPTLLGYSVGQPISLSFTLNASVTPSAAAVPGTYFVWGESAFASPQIFSAVTGTGLSGEFVKPNTGTNVELMVYSANQLRIYFLYDGATGLSAGGKDIYRISADSYYSGLAWNLLGAQPTPTDYFSAYAGTYAVASPINSFIEVENGQRVYYMPTSLNISAVPEPSGYAVMAGLFVLGLVIWRRARVA